MAEFKRKKQRSREQIMEAARGLFEEKGIKHVTFNDIAERAQMCRTTIFNHFATINDLMMAIVEVEVIQLSEKYHASEKKGMDLVYELFDSLIDEVVRYPHMSMWLIAGSISVEEHREGYVKLGKMLMAGFTGTKKEKERKLVQFSGMFYGLINHCLVNEIDLDAKKLKKQFRNYTEVFI